MAGGWTAAPRAAAERSARNLLTGPEQRAANPAGGRGRAGGRRDPAPSPAPAPAPSPRGRRVYSELCTRTERGGAAGQDAPEGAPPQNPAREQANC